MTAERNLYSASGLMVIINKPLKLNCKILCGYSSLTCQEQQTFSL